MTRGDKMGIGVGGEKMIGTRRGLRELRRGDGEVLGGK